MSYCQQKEVGREWTTDVMMTLLLCVIKLLKYKTKYSLLVKSYEVSHIPTLMNPSRACLHVVETRSTNTLLADYTSQNKLLHMERSNAVIS